MNDHVQLAYLILWGFQPVAETVVAFVMWKRKLNKNFPAFYAFLLWDILQFSVLFPIYLAGSYRWYYYGFWVNMAVYVVLGFRVIHEIFIDVFRPYHTLKDLGTVLFKWAALVMLLVSAVVAFSKPTVDQGPIAHAIFTLHRSVRLTQCGLVLFLLVFSKYLGISWKQKSFGLALGFGAFATVEMGVIVLNIGGYISSTTMNLTNLIAMDASILIWLGYMLAESPEREARVSLVQSHRWEQSLSDLQRPVGADSLIPMFEGMVERAFSKNNSNSPAAGQSSDLLFRSDPFRFEYPPNPTPRDIDSSVSQPAEHEPKTN
ncbi:MAG TPA: hypothetical protein VHR84_11340 [Terriglobales bacterium]|jgi:hypothetical protein|nr:hypothetical protein [Terriglobales bacterium]